MVTSCAGKIFYPSRCGGHKVWKIRQYFPDFGQEEKYFPRTTPRPGNRHQSLPSTRMRFLIDLAQQCGGYLGIYLGGSYIHVTE